jgi:hypothetical protein
LKEIIMKKVTIRLLQPYPMPEGLRRPQEGPIEVSADLAAKLIKDKIAASTDAEKAAKGKKPEDDEAAEKAAD